MSDNYYFPEVICAECGKVFHPKTRELWGWKVGCESTPKLVCSYTCQRKYEKKQEEKRKARKYNRSIQVEVVETGEIFSSIGACAAHFNTERQIIRERLRSGEAYKGLHFVCANGKPI